jgi:transposase
MLQITPQMRILVAVEAVDFRKGIDSLAELCRAKLNADPFSGCLFVFRSRRATSIKVLVYDGQGFWLATKRLSKGRSLVATDGRRSQGTYTGTAGASGAGPVRGWQPRRRCRSRVASDPVKEAE